MNAVKEILYVKIEQNTVIKKPDVTIRDVGKIACKNRDVKARVNQIRLYRFPPGKGKKSRQFQTFSVLKVIELIHEIYPQVTVMILGESDFIVHYIEKEEKQGWQLIKAVLVSVIAFFGASFMVITFCKETSLNMVLDFIYTQITGQIPMEATILDLSFCIGLPLGVLVFYNHIGRKKVTMDPTPIQVAMRKYEQDVDMTYLAEKGREGKSIDVD